MPAISCYPDDSVRWIVFQNDRLAVVKGAATEAAIDLRKFALPIDRFSLFRATLEASATQALDLGSITQDDEAKFIFIYADFTGVEDPDDHAFEWAWPLGQGQQAYEWHSSGPLLLLSGSDVARTRGVVMNNTLAVDVPLQVLIAI